MTEQTMRKDSDYTVIGLARFADGKHAVSLAIVATDGSVQNALFTPEAALWTAQQLVETVQRETDRIDPLMLINGKLGNLEARCDVIQNLLVKKETQPIPKVSRKRKEG